MGDRKFLRTQNERNKERAWIVDTTNIRSTFTEEYTSNQTNLDIIEPDEGNRIIVTGVSIHTKANGGTVRLDFNGKKVARLYASANNRFSPVISAVRGDVDESLVLNSTTGSNEVFVSVDFIEEKVRR